MAIKIGMLSSNYNTIISNPMAINALEPIIFAFTNREVQFVKPKNTLEKTLMDAFYRPRVPSYVRLQLADGKLGEVILNALIQLSEAYPVTCKIYLSQYLRFDMLGWKEYHSKLPYGYY